MTDNTEKKKDCGVIPSFAIYKSFGTWTIGLLSGFCFWLFLYSQLEKVSTFFVSMFPVEGGTRLAEALAFFFYDVPKVFLLLALIVFVMRVIRSYFSPARARTLLIGRNVGLGNVAASCLGVVTPFCSCSAVPLFIGFLSAGVPLGVTFSFLIASPMVNEVALGLLIGLVGWKIALIYLAFGLGISVIAGLVIGKLNLESWLQEWVRYARGDSFPETRSNPQFEDRMKEGVTAVREIVSKVGLWILLGIGIGAFIHGYAPTDSLAVVMGKEKWWSVPVAVLLGIPMYANAAGVIPIVEALLGKGAALGTVLAFMMSVIGLSLPEAIILRNVLTIRFIALYFGIVGCGVIAVGFLFNMIY